MVKKTSISLLQYGIMFWVFLHTLFYICNFVILSKTTLMGIESLPRNFICTVTWKNFYILERKKKQTNRFLMVQSYFDSENILKFFICIILYTNNNKKYLNSIMYLMTIRIILCFDFNRIGLISSYLLILF